MKALPELDRGIKITAGRRKKKKIRKKGEGEEGLTDAGAAGVGPSVCVG